MTYTATRSASFSALFILLIASMLTFTACNSGTVVGPEADAPQDVVTLSDQPNDPPSGGTPEPSDGHNTGCPAGDPEC
jgi:hypothetical protein